MYHDQNKHTRFLSFTTYFVNTLDVFILPSKVHFLSSHQVSIFFITLCCQANTTFQFSNEQTATLIFHYPLGMDSWGFSY